MIELNIKTRNIFGKKLKTIKREEMLPAVLYGKNKETKPLFVDAREFHKVWKEAGESTIINLKNGASDSVLIQEVAIDPVKNMPAHIDFLAVEMDKPIQTNVPFLFEGVAPAEKELGAIVVKVMHEVEIEALPKDLPREIKVDLTKLVSLESQIAVKDLILPQGVKVLADADEVVVLAEAHKEEVEQPQMKIEDIEVQKKGKKEEVAEEGEAEKK